MTKRYIVNPDTNRRVDADGCLGLKIINSLKQKRKQIKFHPTKSKSADSAKSKSANSVKSTKSTNSTSSIKLKNGKNKNKNKSNNNNKKISLKNNYLRDVKWYVPPSYPKITNLIPTLIQTNVKSFGWEIMDNKWITDQYKYYKQLSEADKLILLVYTDYGNTVLNEFLLKGVDELKEKDEYDESEIDTIISRLHYDFNTPKELEYEAKINFFYPLFLKHPEIYKLNVKSFFSEFSESGLEELTKDSKESKESDALCKQILNKNLSINARYKKFQKLFNKFFTIEFLERTIEKYMNAFNSNLNRIIDKSPKLKKEILVARGSKHELEYNSDYWSKQFTSTSISTNSTVAFTNRDNPYIDIYILKPNTPCIPIFLTRFRGEGEILLGSGCCRYQIIQKQQMKEVRELANKQFENLYFKLVREPKIRYYEVSKTD